MSQGMVETPHGVDFTFLQCCSGGHKCACGLVHCVKTSCSSTRSDCTVSASAYQLLPAHAVWWHAPFYSGGGYSSEAIAFMLALWSAPQMARQRLSIAQHGDSFEDDAYDVSELNPLDRWCVQSVAAINLAVSCHIGHLSSLASQHAYNWWEQCLQCCCQAMHRQLPHTPEASVH